MIGTLSGVAGQLANVSSFEELGTTVVTVISQVVNVQYTGFFLIDVESEQLRLVAAQGFSESERREAERTAMDRHPGWVLRNAKLLHIPDVEADQHRRTQDSAGRSFYVRSRLYVPVLSGQRCVGAYGLASTQVDGFSRSHIAILQYAANLTGAVYGNLANGLKLRRQLEVISQKQEQLLLLSSPIIEAWARTLVLPIIGTLDNERVSYMAERLLTAVTSRRAQVVILDFTGAASVDQHSSAQLLRIIRAVELLGCRCLLSGISPSLSRQFIEAGSLPEHLQSYRTLQQALGHHIHTKSEPTK